MQAKNICKTRMFWNIFLAWKLEAPESAQNPVTPLRLLAKKKGGNRAHFLQGLAKSKNHFDQT